MYNPEKINFNSNGIRMNAYFCHGHGKGKKPTLIWLHGIPGGPENGKTELTKELCKSGMNVLRFNYQGIWGIKGEFTLMNSLNNLKDAISFLTGKDNTSKYSIDVSKIVLAGYSYGTAVALAGALYDERIENIICIALCDYSYFGRQYMDPYSKLREFLEEAIEGVFSDRTFLKQDPYLFLNNLKDNIVKYDIVRHADKLLSKKILMISGIDDTVCPVEDHLFPLYRRLRELEHKNLKMEINKCGHEPPPDLHGIISRWINENVRKN